MTETKSYETIAANVAAVRENMRQAALQAGRDPEEITLVAATKVQTSQTIRNAIQAGITVCGENRVQELVAHLEDDAYAGARVHFIGHLQTNKVKFVVGKVDMIESIDSQRLMDAVEKQAAKVGVVQDILLEVNIGQEESKGGAKREEITHWPSQVGPPWCGWERLCSAPVRLGIPRDEATSPYHFSQNLGGYSNHGILR